jgi:pimeloyl-ACP methyl ester carboxylesterase
MDNPKRAVSVEQHTGDAHALLGLFSTTPAFIFGTSLGALIGLDLVARWPERVQTIIAHEPPAIALLSSDEQARFAELRKKVGEIALREGARPALRRFLTAMGVNRDDREEDVEPPPSTREHSRKTGFLLTGESRTIYNFLPDLVALRKVANKIVPGFGKSSIDCFPSRCALSLAAQLGREPTEFPGGHTGYVLRPQAFSEMLRSVLLANATSSSWNLTENAASPTAGAECG